MRGIGLSAALAGYAFRVPAFAQGVTSFLGFNYFNSNVALGLYWLSSFLSDSTWYIKNTTEINQVYENCQKAIEADPVCRMSIVCYHYETYYTTETDSKGNTRTVARTRRVNTWAASEKFEFTKAVD